MLCNLVCSAVQTVFSTTIGHLAHEIGLDELFEAGINELRQVDVGGYGQKAVEAIRSAGDGVSGFIRDEARELVNTALDLPSVALR